MVRICDKTTDAIICYEDNDMHCDVCFWNENQPDILSYECK